ncbi:MAG: VOC family protein, partial [bacterium]
MIVGVQDVYVYVADMERAIRFYGDLLGLKVTHNDGHWAALDVGGVRMGLHATGGSPVPAVPRDAGGARAGATLTLRSTNIDEDVGRLKIVGVRFLGSISRADWGAAVAFEDPD